MADSYALVTGASSGIGKEICLSLLKNNVTVFGVSRQGSDIDHSHYVDILADIRDELAVEDMYRIVGESTDGLDLIVNCAGICIMSPLHEVPSKEFLDHLLTNVVGPFHILKHGIEFVIEQETHVINISSMAAKEGLPDMASYCASKFALSGLIQSCSKEWAAMGVRFTTLNPGAIDTPLWDNINSEAPREKMMTVEDFINVFEMVINSSSKIEFPDISFVPKTGIIS